MDSIILWRIIFWILLVMLGISVIMSFTKGIDWDIQEKIVDIFKDVSTVIIIPIILVFLQPSKEVSPEYIKSGLWLLGLFIIVLIWCDFWPIFRKWREKKNRDNNPN